ncbi:hypothetical protein NMG60_11025514 [Bertholletia excelsa]
MMINHKRVLKDSWEGEYFGSSEEDLLSGFSWPPRSYTCSFCKREFRSAQALGGHMNVHRRDRARLRQSPPRDAHYSSFLNLNVTPSPNPESDPDPNPNPNQSSSPSMRFATFASLSSFSSPSSASPSGTKRWVAMGTPSFHADLTKIKPSKTLFGGFGLERESVTVEKAEMVRLNLEVGLISESRGDLDLELRLGRS